MHSDPLAFATAWRDRLVAQREAHQKRVIHSIDGLTCEWFARCANDADGVADHPILGDVPICRRCAESMDMQETS